MGECLSSGARCEIMVSIVIVNYNGKHFFKECLASIERTIKFRHEVIVVDNASTDGSCDYLRANYPNILLVENEKNLGFSGGNNIGARYAKGKYILLLNNDTILKEELEGVIGIMEDDSSIGVAGIRMLGKNGEYRFSAGRFPEPFRLFKFSSLYNRKLGFDRGRFPQSVDIYDVDWIEGSFLLTPLRLWRRVGGLDESYFMYVEDIDYCKKIRDCGMRTVYLPAPSYVHYGGYGESRIRMLVFGFRHYHRRHSGPIKRFLANAVLDFGLIVRALIFGLRAISNRQKREQAVRCVNALRRRGL